MLEVVWRNPQPPKRRRLRIAEVRADESTSAPAWVIIYHTILRRAGRKMNTPASEPKPAKTNCGLVLDQASRERVMSAKNSTNRSSVRRTSFMSWFDGSSLTV